jgi:hypothetical protein
LPTLQKIKIHKWTKYGQQVTTVWRNGGFSASYDSFVVGSSAVLRLNFNAKNPPLRQAATVGCNLRKKEKKPKGVR